MDYAGLGRRIKAARRAQSMTQENLAERVGISLSFVGHIERGSRKASIDTLVKISNVLGESLNDLLRDSLDVKPMAGAQASKDFSEPANENSDILNELNNYVGRTRDNWND